MSHFTLWYFAQLKQRKSIQTKTKKRELSLILGTVETARSFAICSLFVVKKMSDTLSLTAIINAQEYGVVTLVRPQVMIAQPQMPPIAPRHHEHFPARLPPPRYRESPDLLPDGPVSIRLTAAPRPWWSWCNQLFMTSPSIQKVIELRLIRDLLYWPVDDGVKRRAQLLTGSGMEVIRSTSPQLVPFKLHRFGQQRRGNN